MPALSAMPAAEQYAELLARADALAASEASQNTEAIELYSSALALIPADNALQLPAFAARRQECEAGRAACLKALGDHAAAVRAAAAVAAHGRDAAGLGSAAAGEGGDGAGGPGSLEQRVRRARIMPVIALNDASEAVPLCRALAAGGLRSAEITFRTSAGREGLRLAAEAFQVSGGGGGGGGGGCCCC